MVFRPSVLVPNGNGKIIFHQGDISWINENASEGEGKTVTQTVKPLDTAIPV
jgi:hypothetical protein